MDTVSNPPPTEPLPGRRTFFRWLTYGLGVVATAALGIPFIGYLFGARKAPVEWLPLGPITDFAQDQTRRVTFDNPLRQPWDGMVARTGVYVRYEGPDEAETDETKKHKFLVLAVNCAHLGCPVEWFQESGLFMCPCHGGVYYSNGERASGPPPRGLFRCVYRVTRAGGTLQLEVQAPHFPTLQDTLQHPA
ncbi:MAG TPA: Rieske 2Fe-2S domain-containing protein [Gemmataceae bacterium]|jgi:Rieske Fe-S protein